MRYDVGMKVKAERSPEFNRFNALVGSVLSVPKAVLDDRETEYKKQAKANPKKRGRKPKKNQ